MTDTKAMSSVKGIVTKYGAWVPPEVLNSMAYANLSGGQIRTYEAFLRRLRKIPVKNRRGKRKAEYATTNADSLILPYRTAAAELRISQAGFRKCIDRLVELGFLDIMPTEVGEAEAIIGTFNPATIYSISDRYKLWGTSEFVSATRPREQRHLGWQGLARGNTRVKEAATAWQIKECVTPVTQGEQAGGLGAKNGGTANNDGPSLVSERRKRCVTPVMQDKGAPHNPGYAALHNHGYAGNGETA